MSFGVWLRLGRVSNLPTVWSNALAGSLLAGSSPDVPSGIGLCAAFSCYYVGGMFLNDAFDREVDAVERPDRPIVSGVVRASTVFGAGFTLLAIGVLSTFWLAFAHPVANARLTLVSGLGLAVLIVLYDAFHKNNPLSPLLMGLCRVMVYVTAALATAKGVGPAVWLGAAALLFHLIGLTYAAKQETLAALRSVWPLGFLVLPVVYGGVLAAARPLVAWFAVLYALGMVNALTFLKQGPKRSIPGAILRFIAGISLLDAVLLASARADALALIAVGFAGVTRLAQRFVPGT